MVLAILIVLGAVLLLASAVNFISNVELEGRNLPKPQGVDPNLFEDKSFMAFD
jgi:hypothetical protein